MCFSITDGIRHNKDPYQSPLWYRIWKYFLNSRKIANPFISTHTYWVQGQILYKAQNNQCHCLKKQTKLFCPYNSCSLKRKWTITPIPCYQLFNCHDKPIAGSASLVCRRSWLVKNKRKSRSQVRVCVGGWNRGQVQVESFLQERDQLCAMT